jgi:hypothetical protein
MTSSFSFARLGKLITKQFYENAKLYLFSVLAMFGLLALVFSFWVLAGGSDYREEATWIIFVFGLLIAGSIFASMSFNMLGSKDKGLYWLSVPATHFEKLVCTILYTTVLFTLAYCLCFFAVKSLTILFLDGFLKTHPGTSYTKMQDYEHGFGGAIKYFIYGYFAVQSLYLLGSVYFPRYSFVVTTVVGAATIFAFAYYITRIDDAMMDPISWNMLSARRNDTGIKDSYFLYTISPTVSSTLKFAFQFLWAPLLWTVTWFRLKEKEL